MDRRNFLTLLASAPIAALAPWPKVLKNYVAVDPTLGIAIRFVKQWDIGPDVVGYMGKGPDWFTYVSQPKTDAERLALKMVTEARARFAR